MKVIGAGLPRTATLTQKIALEMLGVGPCYHMVDVLADLDRVKHWQQALDGDARWPEIFDGYQSTVDWPGGFFYRELIDFYPEAKVLLSIRDPDGWERSMRDTVWSVYHGDSLMRHLSSARARVDPRWRSYLDLLQGLLWKERGTLADRHRERQGLIDAMGRHNEEVQRAVPPERLLVWKPSDGWEPLCRFLGVEVPQAPLPRVNDSETFADRVIESALGVLQGWWDGKRSEATKLSAARPVD